MMSMMAATHGAINMAGGFLLMLFLAGVALFLWAYR
jgi:hypothetical protein